MALSLRVEIHLPEFPTAQMDIKKALCPLQIASEVGRLFLWAELVLCTLPLSSSARIQPELAGHGAAAWQLGPGTA